MSIVFLAKLSPLGIMIEKGGIVLEQYGEVVMMEGEKAKVQVRRHRQCKKCNLCSCDSILMVEAHNPIHAKTGQIVLLKMDSRRVLGATFLIYIFPLLMILVGYLLGSHFSGQREELVGFITGMLFLGLSFLIVRSMDQYLGNRWDYKPTIQYIIGGDANGEKYFENRGDELSTLRQSRQGGSQRDEGHTRGGGESREE